MTRYALAQINTTVGDLHGNADKILQIMKEVAEKKPDLVIFPEMTLTGYPPEDLLLKPGFFNETKEILNHIIPQIQGRALLGYPSISPVDNKPYNTAALVEDGKIITEYYKCLLPNYAVFDEKRYFGEGQQGLNLKINNQICGVVICEDAWEENGPIKDETENGAGIIACLSASPFHKTKEASRIKTFSNICKKQNAYLLYCNLVGGQDELVFDGASFVMSPEGEILAKAESFKEEILFFDTDAELSNPVVSSKRPVKTLNLNITAENKPAIEKKELIQKDKYADTYQALVLGVGDYVRKNGFSGVIIGLSGGIDSALTAAIAVDALGKENVLGVTMPSRYSSDDTKDDARILAQNLGIRFESLAIEEPFKAFSTMLEPIFSTADSTKDPENLTDQNLQARIRAVYLMGLSNKFGLLLLNTSNKSESAVGYGTLYGDMAGGYAAIKDVLKTDVWAISYYVNKLHNREIIPVSTIERVPSAELRPDQEDRQSLPDYPVLDPILELYVEQDMTYSEIIAAGHDPEIVRKIIHLTDRSEFKRRQSVIGPRVTPKAFGKDRRLPLTNCFRPK